VFNYSKAILQCPRSEGYLKKAIVFKSLPFSRFLGIYFNPAKLEDSYGNYNITLATFPSIK